MLPSKFRCGGSDILRSEPSASVSKPISVPKLTRACSYSSPEINSKFLRNNQRQTSKSTSFPKKRIIRVSEMQQQMGQIEEELKKAKEQLTSTEEERDQAIDELREMKKLAQEANMKLSEASRKISELYTEISTVKESLSNRNKELKIKENIIASLKLEVQMAKQLELKLAEKDASLNKLKEEMNSVKVSETQAIDLLSERATRINELEAELEKRVESETKMFDWLASQTKELEQTKIMLEESKLEIASLYESRVSGDVNHSLKEELETLKAEHLLTKGNTARSQEREKVPSLISEKVLEEMGLLKTELKLAMEAEEKSKKAMDDLALALKEVSREANQVKEKLSATDSELEISKKEREKLQNAAERLKLEAEESLSAWNEREVGLVNCIKVVEEERNFAQQENIRLIESLRTIEGNSRVPREESQKLRDILKQALNEASVAKEAAGIAREENSQLKDFLAEKEDALDILTRENERLQVNEAAALENIKELNRLLSAASATEVKAEDKSFMTTNSFKTQWSMSKEQKNGKKLEKAQSLNLGDLKLWNKNKDINDKSHIRNDDELMGSIFDMVESPESGSHNRKDSSVFGDGETINSDDFDHLDAAHFDDMDNDRNSMRKRRAFLRRFGDLIRRRSFQKKESSAE